MKQAIARNLNDPQLSAAPVVPTDRVALDRLPEEDQPIESLISEAYATTPDRAGCSHMKNNRITIKAEKNGLLPVLDAFAFYGATGLGGAQNPALSTSIPVSRIPRHLSGHHLRTALGDLFNSSSPNKGVGVNLTIPLRNRTPRLTRLALKWSYASPRCACSSSIPDSHPDHQRPLRSHQ